MFGKPLITISKQREKETIKEYNFSVTIHSKTISNDTQRFKYELVQKYERNYQWWQKNISFQWFNRAIVDKINKTNEWFSKKRCNNTVQAVMLCLYDVLGWEGKLHRVCLQRNQIKETKLTINWLGNVKFYKHQLSFSHLQFSNKSVSL